MIDHSVSERFARGRGSLRGARRTHCCFEEARDCPSVRLLLFQLPLDWEVDVPCAPIEPRRCFRVNVYSPASIKLDVPIVAAIRPDDCQAVVLAASGKRLEQPEVRVTTEELRSNPPGLQVHHSLLQVHREVPFVKAQGIARRVNSSRQQVTYMNFNRRSPSRRIGRSTTRSRPYRTWGRYRAGAI